VETGRGADTLTTLFVYGKLDISAQIQVVAQTNFTLACSLLFLDDAVRRASCPHREASHMMKTLSIMPDPVLMFDEKPSTHTRTASNTNPTPVLDAKTAKLSH
jgi:hypothetical protein